MAEYAHLLNKRPAYLSTYKGKFVAKREVTSDPLRALPAFLFQLFDCINLQIFGNFVVLWVILDYH